MMFLQSAAIGLESDKMMSVSPYIVRNDTGYPIEVSSDLSKLNESSQSTRASILKKTIHKVRLLDNEEKGFEIDSMNSIFDVRYTITMAVY